MNLKTKHQKNQYEEFEKELNFKLGNQYDKFNSIMNEVQNKFKFQPEILQDYKSQWKKNNPTLYYFVKNYKTLLEKAISYEKYFIDKNMPIDEKTLLNVVGKLKDKDILDDETLRGNFILEYLSEKYFK